MTDMPSPRGQLQQGRLLAPLTWLRVGGEAEWFFLPADRADLSQFLKDAPGIDVHPMGLCSNVIIRDGGLPGVSIKLGRSFQSIEILDGHRVRVGAAALDAQVARRAAEAGISGLEFLRTIPGAIGGAVKMNAGCYGSYIADVLEEVTVIGRDGTELTLSADEITFGYRTCSLADDTLVVEAVLKGRPGQRAKIEALMDSYVTRRERTQPVKERSAGSTFRNPAGFSSTGEAGDPMDLKAWRLIDEAGCRGLRLGGAQMSEKHPNFMINTGNATAADLENLGEEVRKRVKSHSGHDLAWEIRRIGVKVDKS